MISRDLLHKFFKGSTTVSEEKEIRQWMEDEEENNRFFLEERRVYDSILLNGTALKSKNNKFKRITLWNRIIQVAAIFLLFSTLGLLLNKYFEDRSSYEQLHTLIVPPGQRINLILADNSSIWLNANTVFKYPTKFSKKQRNVYLDGEAYFDVSANKKQPFIVTTPQGGIKVTGTTFNVSAYSKYNKFETSLFKGNVSVFLKSHEDEVIEIKPKQKTVIKNGKLEIVKIENFDEFLWRKGLIAFNNKKLEDILMVLEQYFDTKIQIETNSLPKNTYTGKFRQSDGIDYALRVLQKSIHFTYERNDEEQVIYIKNQLKIPQCQ